MPSRKRISETFAQLKHDGRMAFIPFVTAGDPNLDATSGLVRLLADAGADLIEIGFPYSDPIADGPVIQASYTRALAHQLHVHDIFATVGNLPTEELPPLVGMVSYAIVFRLGPRRFAQLATEAGFSGLIIPDLPGGEADDMADVAAEFGLDLIPLIAPTTPDERVARILAKASGFVYCIAVSGITGVRQDVSDNLLTKLDTLRTRTDLPLAVGFGIGTPDNIRTLKGHADGAIVGSALVRYLEKIDAAPDRTDEILSDLKSFASGMADAAHE